MLEDIIANTPASYWTSPIKSVRSSCTSGFIKTTYLKDVTVIEIPCCISLTALVDPEHSHREDCEALQAVRSWEGRWF